MAQIPIITQWKEAQPHLVSLKGTIERDFRPMLAVNNDQRGAPFSICREVMSYIDHLGHLYTGTSGCDKRFKAFMDSVLGEVYNPYRQRAGEVYQMYRCGTVHEFEPKMLENKKGQLLRWLCYQGNRIGHQTELEVIGKLTVTHLEPVALPSGLGFALPVSTKCLLDDLGAAIDRFIGAGPEDERVTAWNRAARELTQYKAFDFTV